MKWNNCAMYLLAVALLLVTASAVGATETSTSPAVASQPQATSLPGAGCAADAAPLVSLAGLEPVPTSTSYCGYCSTFSCQGAEIGQLCYLSGQGSFGHCNTFSGGFMCSEGGWDCQCSGGALP